MSNINKSHQEVKFVNDTYEEMSFLKLHVDAIARVAKVIDGNSAIPYNLSDAAGMNLAAEDADRKVDVGDVSSISEYRDKISFEKRCEGIFASVAKIVSDAKLYANIHCKLLGLDKLTDLMDGTKPVISGTEMKILVRGYGDCHPPSNSYQTVETHDDEELFIAEVASEVKESPKKEQKTDVAVEETLKSEKKANDVETEVTAEADSSDAAVEKEENGKLETSEAKAVEEEEEKKTTENGAASEEEKVDEKEAAAEETKEEVAESKVEEKDADTTDKTSDESNGKHEESEEGGVKRKVEEEQDAVETSPKKKKVEESAEKEVEKPVEEATPAVEASA